MFEKCELQLLKDQWGKEGNLDQYAIVHLIDETTKWHWYFLNISPDESIGWAIVDGVDLEIEKIDMEIIQDMNFLFLDGIKRDDDFLPIKATRIWQMLKAKRFPVLL